MEFCNKHFWKFVGGFVVILAVAIGSLWGFRYWQNYKDNQGLKTLLKEIRDEEQKWKSAVESSSEIPRQSSEERN